MCSMDQWNSAPDEDDSSDDDDDMPPLIPADNWEPHLGAADQVTQVT